MKNFKSIFLYGVLSLLIVSGINSCKKNDEGQGAPVITRIRTVYKSTQTSQSVTAFDSTTNVGQIGTLYAIIGKNLMSTQEIYINGVSIYFNTAYASNTTLQFSVPSSVPFSSDSTNNTITLVNRYGKTSFPFVIQQPVPSITLLSQYAGNPGDVITITGTTFNGLSSVMFGTLPGKVITKTSTVITAEVPTGFTYGAVTVTTAATKGGGIGTGPPLTSGVSELSNNVTAAHQSNAIFGFSTAIFEDAAENGWSIQGGWDGTPYKIDSTKARRGIASISYTYSGGYNGFVINAGNGNTVDANTAIKFSIYGGPGTTGKNIHLVLNYVFNTSVQLTLTAGQWTDYQIPIANFVDASDPAPSNISALVFQEYSGNASQFNLDDVGLVELK
jgi:hypothetical protein